MPRRRRKDYTGAWWHVGNRGVERGALFLGPEDYRYFLSLLAHAVHRLWIEIHAYCLMPNHFHLLVRSLGGDLSAAMQWIEDKYARWFNRRRDRQGCLFEGRFWGKIICSLIYRMVAFGYIHANPRRAGLEVAGCPYEYSSERHFESGRGRPWLSRAFGSRLTPAARSGELLPADLAERWRLAPNQDLHELDELLIAPAAGVCDWLVDNASRLERPMRPRFLVVPDTLTAVLDRMRTTLPTVTVRLGRQPRDAWPLLGTGLARTVCATALRDLAAQADITMSTADSRIRLHRRALLEDPAYAQVAGSVLHACLDADYGRLLHEGPFRSRRKR